MALSTQPYKGARDFYPEDKRLQKYMFAHWREVCERFGYEEYDAPILEPLDIYLAKTGEEIVNEQTYTFTDRGDRKVVIRPEMTPSVSRMVAGRRQTLSYPLRWYSIPNLWRYERPQRGRLREHWQLNVDIFGLQGINAELEIISLVDAVFKSFGADHSMYEIRLNHRGLVDYLLGEYLGLSQETQLKVSKLIDRFHKTDRSKFLTQLDEIIDSKQRQAGASEKLMSLITARELKDLPKAALEQDCAKDLKALLDKLKNSGVDAVFDGSLMRGFDYYTGIVFEVYDNNPDNNRSMLGGGRYDGLVGLFGVAPVPTVGFGWGDVTLANFLEGHHLMPELKPETDACVVVIGEVDTNQAVTELRNAGLNISVDYSGRKIGDQIKAASKKGVAWVIVIGEEELNTSKFALKNLSTGEEHKLQLNDIVKKLRSTKDARH